MLRSRAGKAFVCISLALVGLSATGTVAEAHTTITCDPCSFQYQHWADEARVPTANVIVELIEAPCPVGGSVACVDYAGHLYDARAGGGAASSREYLYHEMGHLFDHYVLPQWMRRRFMRLAGLHEPWAIADWTWEDGMAPPNEQFAEAYEGCATYGPRLPEDVFDYWTVSATTPRAVGQRLHGAICRMLDRL